MRMTIHKQYPAREKDSKDVKNKGVTHDYQFSKYHGPLFVPPVEFKRGKPMSMWTPRGLFGIDRIRGEVTVSTNAGSFSYRPVQNHVGIDLDAPRGAPVFAARRGQIVQIGALSGDSTNQWIAICHTKEGGRAFTTRYMHLQEVVVSKREFVSHGDFLGFTGPLNHLHFEVHIIMNTRDLAEDWHRINIEPVDPTPFLYPWEKIYFEEIMDEVPSTQPPAPIQEVRVLRKSGVPMFQVRQNNKYYHIPLYYLDPGDKQLVGLLQDAFVNNCRNVRLATRDSYFFRDRTIITAARVIS